MLWIPGPPGNYFAAFETTPVLFRGLLYLTPPLGMKLLRSIQRRALERLEIKPPWRLHGRRSEHLSEELRHGSGGGKGECAPIFIGY